MAKNDKELKNEQAVEETVEPAPEQEAPAQPETEEAQEAPQPTAEEWQQALETAVKQRDEYLAMAQRAQADYQNFKRRNSTTRADAYDDGVRETLAALLPSLDNLERAIAASNLPEEDQMLAGVKMTLKQMFEAMSKMGLETVGEVGETFDPEKHNAVMRAEGEGEPGCVLEIFQKGYRVKERMLRYAMVKIEAET